jgi:hypothetical protein
MELRDRASADRHHSTLRVSLQVGTPWRPNTADTAPFRCALARRATAPSGRSGLRGQAARIETPRAGALRARLAGAERRNGSEREEQNTSAEPAAFELQRITASSRTKGLGFQWV